jgi:hypothetical protein
MKMIFRLCAIAFFSIALSSCSKTDLSIPQGGAPPTPDAFISSRIEPNIVEPADMTLGTTSAVLHQGDKMTIFVPYSISNESFVTATVTMTDDATGLPINTYDLVPSTDALASNITLPQSLFNQQNFYFLSFIADENYGGKTVTITTTLVGEVTHSTEVLNAAFSVIAP